MGALAAIVLTLGLAASATPATPPEGGTAAPAADRSALTALADQARDAAVAVRGLRPKHPLKVEVASRLEIERYVEARIVDTDARKQFVLTSAALSAMGVLDAAYDLEAFVRRIGREQVAGYYDWERKELFVADWIPALLQRPTLVHESTHALQDQAFDIGRFMKPIDGLSEPTAAVDALIEGDATLVMLAALAGADAPLADLVRRLTGMYDKLSTLLDLASGLADVPPVLKDGLLFPYFGGLTLVVAAWEAGGWARVDALYRDPPITTEQVLHPPKLLGAKRDDPREVRVVVDAARAGAGFADIGSDIMGELSVRLVLEQSLAKDEAAKAAEGWGGDRFVALRRASDGAVVLVWASVWDTDGDAREAEAALRKTKAPPLRLERRGDAIVGLWGAAPADADALLKGAWGGLKSTVVHDVAGWRKAMRR